MPPNNDAAPPAASASASVAASGEGGDDSPPSSRNPLTTVRVTVSPYLPPPVIATLARFDSHPLVVSNLSLYTPEPSTAIIITALAAFVVLQILKLVRLPFGGRRSSLHEDDEDDVLCGALRGKAGDVGVGTSSGLKDFGDTVTLCGPAGAGKTVLFHALCRPAGSESGSNGNGAAESATAGTSTGTGGQLLTVTSMRASTGLLGSKTAADPSYYCADAREVALDSKAVRIIDYPGHPSLRSRLSSALAASDRMFLILDSTKPVTDGASILFSALTDPALISAWDDKWKLVAPSSSKRSNKMPILIVCSKADLPKAKNWKRMKIQLRTELERLEKVGGMTAGVSPGVEGGIHGSASLSERPRLLLGKGSAGGAGQLDLDDLGEDVPVTLRFLSVGGFRDGEGMDSLRDFARSGAVPSNGR